MQQEARHPQLVADGDAFRGTHLILPLRRHHFRILAADLNSGVQAGAIVRLDHVAAEHAIAAHAAVVRALRARIAALRPAYCAIAIVRLLCLCTARKKAKEDAALTERMS